MSVKTQQCGMRDITILVLRNITILVLRNKGFKRYNFIDVLYYGVHCFSCHN
jgi:hypothetical protein